MTKLVIPKDIPAIGRAFLRALPAMKKGEAAVITPEGHRFVFKGEEPGPCALFIIHDWKAITNLITKGDIGFAEDYVAGLWETDDLPTLLTVATMNIDHIEEFFHGHWWYRVYIALKHLLNRNTKSGSKKNIRAHYDLGNDFYSLWLDKTMTYSSALFGGDASRTLEEAQLAKYQRILERLGAKPGDHILEIGCGWGGFAEAAAKHGCTVTGITLSQEQLDFARERMKKQGLQDKVNIEFCDYRDIKGQFDHIVSIEMFEAVGLQYWPAYFSILKNCLKKGGKAIIQTITIDDRVFNDYSKRSDFIQQYTFPGGMLPSFSRFVQEAREAGLHLKDKFAFGHDYATTLGHWLQAFDRAGPHIEALGFKEQFLKQWRFYLSYCIAAFSSQRTNVMQVELTHG